MISHYIFSYGRTVFVMATLTNYIGFFMYEYTTTLCLCCTISPNECTCIFSTFFQWTYS